MVDPYAYQYQGNESPEAQAFVMLMQAAYRDWVNAVASSVNATDIKKSGALRTAMAGGGAAGTRWMAAVFVVLGACVHWTLL